MSTETPENSNIFMLDSEAVRRMEICQKCKYFEAETTKCIVCGCNIKGNLNNDKANCPVGKW